MLRVCQISWKYLGPLSLGYYVIRFLDVFIIHHIFTEYPYFRMVISQSISHIMIMLFCILQNNDTRCYRQACKAIAGSKIQPVHIQLVAVVV